MMFSLPEHSIGYCVAPTFGHTRKQWREIKYYCPPELIEVESKATHTITLFGDREIQFKSADNADTMRGDAVCVVWMDEGGQIQEDRWTMELRPSLMDTHGKAIFTGTPKGKNWYFQLWTRGQDKSQTDYESWAFSSYTNPYIDPKEIDEFKRDMPELAYRQEILAEFLDDVGSVFRGFDRFFKGSVEEPQKGHRYGLGVDLGKLADFTVLYVIDFTNNHIVFEDRFDTVDWVLQRKRVVNIARRYNNARILIDSHGIGDPIFDDLKREYSNIEGYNIKTNALKLELIDHLSICIDNQSFTVPGNPPMFEDGKKTKSGVCAFPILDAEMGLFGYRISKAGVKTYSAPEGYHDDTVIALALAVWHLGKPKPNPSFLLLGGS